MAGDTCYDVLQAILTMLDAVIYFDGSRMVIMREADLSDLKQGASIHTASGGLVPVRAFGSMRTYDIWPVGQMSCQIEPARSGVSVSCESHYTDDLVPPLSEWSFASVSDGYVTSSLITSIHISSSRFGIIKCRRTCCSRYTSAIC